MIARSVGRALPERIAATHRLSYLEDIAAAVPEVAAWVRTSGLTLEELSSITPDEGIWERNELEGVALVGLAAHDGTATHIQILELNNEVGSSDDVYLWGLAVADPALL